MSFLSTVTRNKDLCNYSPSEHADRDCGNYNQSVGPMVFIFLSQFVSGIGTTLFSTLGMTYVDDNVKSKQMPMLIGTTAYNFWFYF